MMFHSAGESFASTAIQFPDCRCSNLWLVLAGCSMMMILSAAGGTTDQQQGWENVDFFDRLRLEATAVEFSEERPDSKVAKVLAADNTTYRLAHIVSFLPFSNRTHARSGVHNHAAGAILAIHHFNHRETSPILQDLGLENCNVRLTTEFIDSQFDPVASTSVFLKDISLRDRELEKSPAAAILGAYRSAVTSPLAILSGVNEMLQITPFSTSSEFSNREQYPYLSRTCPSAEGEAQVAVDYFKFLGERWGKPVGHVAVLYVSDTFGLAVQTAFRDFATNANIQTVSFQFSFSSSPSEIAKAVKALADSMYRYFYVVCFEDHYPAIMKQAHESGIVGNDFLWVFHGPDLKSFQQSAKYHYESALYNATKGIGILQFGVKEHENARIPAEDGEVEVLPENPTGAQDKIKVAWRRAIQEPVFASYVRSHLPKTLEQMGGYDEDAPFELDMSSGPSYSYDSVTAIGIAMCRAEPDFFVASDVEPYVEGMSFNGATGAVTLGEKGTRTFETVQFTVWNVLPREEEDLDGKDSFRLTPSYSYEEGSWKSVGDNLFIFADGTAIPPDVLPPIDTEQERVSTGGFVAGLLILGLALLSSLYCLCWTIGRRREPIVCASQLPFLLMISGGALVSSLAIVPLAIQESTNSRSLLDAACMASPWLFTSGLSIAFSALSLKVWRLYEIYRHADLDRLFLSHRDFVVWGCGFFVFNSLLMTLWTTQSPWQWTEKTGETTDVFGRTSSYYSCENPDGSDEPYAVISLIAFYVLTLVLALLGSYCTRELETEYRESQYIGYALLSELETLVVAFPFVALVDSNPGARFFLEVGLVFLTSFIPLSLIFFPKMQALRKLRERERANERRGLFSSHQRRARDAEFDPNSGSDPNSSSNPNSKRDEQPPCRADGGRDRSNDDAAAPMINEELAASSDLTPEGFVAIDRKEAAAAAAAACSKEPSAGSSSSATAEYKEVTEQSDSAQIITSSQQRNEESHTETTTTSNSQVNGLRVMHHPKVDQQAHVSQYSLGGTRISQQQVDLSSPMRRQRRRGSYHKDERW